MIRGPWCLALRRLATGAALLAASATAIGAQAAAPPADSLAILRVVVRHDSAAVPRAIVRALPASDPARGTTPAALTDAEGGATLRVAPGGQLLLTTRLGFRPDTLRLTLRAALDTSVVVQLVEAEETIEAVVVTATRGERRVEDTPLRVEVIDEEEIAEKVAMTPGDIAMMLNETSGLRVQATHPSLGGANVRIQGLRGRYTLLLADGLPLYGGQTGGLGLLQIPPVDLARVEVIKGTASALYGSAALGGVIDLVSRRPAESAERTLLVNRTSRGGTDGVFFGRAPLSPQWGYTLLAGVHGQERRDVDADGWTDIPGYRRAVVRPRLHFDDGEGRTAFLTGGFTAEDRRGGTLAGGRTPDGGSFAEALRTRRADVGALTRWMLPGDGTSVLRGAIITLRGSAMEQRHAHRFGAVVEDDRHRTWFGEVSIAVPRGAATWIVGGALQHDGYDAEQLSGFDYDFTIPALFAQLDVDATPWLALSSSARVDAHPEYRTFVNPRISLLLRLPSVAGLAGWTTRLSAGTGAFAPTPFTEETEATGLSPLAPLSGLVAERAGSGSLDIGGPVALGVGTLELNATLFGSRVRHPLRVIAEDGATAGGASRLALANAPAATRTWGGELLARLTRALGEEREGSEPPALRVTATYTLLRATECDPSRTEGNGGTIGGGCVRRDVPLAPRHAAGMVASIEREGESRVGLELYYTGTQALEDNPFRRRSEQYLIVGLLGERAVPVGSGTARLFLNLENLTGVRQTRYDPLLRSERGPGGRWTTDAWTELAGFTLNGGVRWLF